MANKYPSWRFHSSEPARVVQDEAEDKALGKGWHKSPEDVFRSVKSEPEPPPKPVTPVTVDEVPSLPHGAGKKAGNIREEAGTKAGKPGKR